MNVFRDDYFDILFAEKKWQQGFYDVNKIMNYIKKKLKEEPAGILSISTIKQNAGF